MTKSTSRIVIGPPRGREIREARGTAARCKSADFFNRAKAINTSNATVSAGKRGKMAKVNKYNSTSKGKKLSRNETLIEQNTSEDEITLPEPYEKSKKKSWIKSMFQRKKESEKGTGEKLKIDYPITGSAQEPDLLMDIDLGHYKNSVEPELALWLNDGRIVKSLEELAKSLKTMKGRAFSQHQENNEIGAWVRDATGNAQLAAEITTAKTKNDVIRILENHIKESKRKKKTKPSEKAENIEIQKAIEEIRKKPEALEKSSSLEEREKLLEEKESQLEMEEDIINKKRMALANRRYQLIKARGELEKEKFQRIVTHHYKEMKEAGAEQNKAGLPEMELAPEYTKEKIQQLIEQARAELNNGDTGSAKKTITELKEALDYAAIEPSEIKRLEYDVLELEADLKLAMLA